MSDSKAARAARKPAPAEIPANQPSTPPVDPTSAPFLPASEPAIAPIAAAAIEPMPPVAAPVSDSFAPGKDAWAAWAEAQSAVARGFDAAAVAFAGLARSGIAAVSDAAIAMLQIKTLADAIEVGGGFARRSADALIEGSAQLSEIGVKAAAEASRPILTRLGTPWEPARSA